MEEKKNQFITETNKFIIKKNNKSVNFLPNNNSNKLFFNIKNFVDNNSKKNIISKSNDINNKKNYVSIDSSPNRNQNYIFNRFRKQSFQSSNSLFNTFKSNTRKNSINIETNNYQFSQNINTISSPFKSKKISLKRLNTAFSRDSIEQHLINDFNSKEKRISNSNLCNKIYLRNCNKLNFCKKRLSILKNEGNTNTITTSLISDRNRKDGVKFNQSRRNSLSNSIKKNFKLFKRSMTISRPKIERKPNFIQKKKKIIKQNMEPIIVNPLLIAEEDKIFDEMKKYLCFKYEQRRLHTKSNESKKNFDKNKANSSKLKKVKNKMETADKMKLDYLYLSTSKINKKIRYVKRKKDKQNLAEYQDNLLDVVKPTVSDYTYVHLKERLINIRIKNNKKYQYNYKKIKEIEMEEEDIINDFNHTCKKFLQTLKSVRAKKEMVHSVNLKVKLPLLNFISCLKKKKKQIKRK